MDEMPHLDKATMDELCIVVEGGMAVIAQRLAVEGRPPGLDLGFLLDTLDGVRKLDHRIVQRLRELGCIK